MQKSNHSSYISLCVNIWCLLITVSDKFFAANLYERLRDCAWNVALQMAWSWTTNIQIAAILNQFHTCHCVSVHVIDEVDEAKNKHRKPSGGFGVLSRHDAVGRPQSLLLISCFYLLYFMFYHRTDTTHVANTYKMQLCWGQHTHTHTHMRQGCRAHDDDCQCVTTSSELFLG